MTNKKKIQSIQTVRALAFIGIFLSHCNFGVLFRLGPLGVGVFFLLSGFLMTYTYYGLDSIRQCGFIHNIVFAWNKIKHIYGLHIITMLIAIPIRYFECIMDQSTFSIIGNVKNILLNIVLVQSWIPDVDVAYALNGVAWYLSTCIIQYFAFPWIIQFIRKIKSKKMALYIILASFVIQVLYAGSVKLIPGYEALGGGKFGAWAIYVFPLSRLIDFFIGCNIGYIFLNRQTNDRKDTKFVHTIFEVMAISLLLFSLTIYSKSFIVNMGWVVLWIIPSSLIIYLFACNEGLISKLLTNRVTVGLGDLSAYTFLIHQLVLKSVFLLVSYFFGKEYMKNPIVLLTAFILSIIFAKLWSYIAKNKRKI